MIPGTGTGAGRWGWLSPDLGNALSYLLLRMWVSVGLRGCLLHDPPSVRFASSNHAWSNK